MVSGIANKIQRVVRHGMYPRAYARRVSKAHTVWYPPLVSFTSPLMFTCACQLCTCQDTTNNREVFNDPIEGNHGVGLLRWAVIRRKGFEGRHGDAHPHDVGLVELHHHFARGLVHIALLILPVRRRTSVHTTNTPQHRCEPESPLLLSRGRHPSGNITTGAVRHSPVCRLWGRCV